MLPSVDVLNYVHTTSLTAMRSHVKHLQLYCGDVLCTHVSTLVCVKLYLMSALVEGV
jgi:hypothetical protein